jgi:formate dehydrogenase maturation protein FdhE
MAQFKVSTSVADPVQPYLEGVAKSLVDRLYGADGPAWGTKLTEIEDTIKAIRQVLSEKMLADALQRQANTVAHRPAAWQCCPKCGTEVADKAKEDAGPRRLQTDVGEAKWHEPQTYCRQCRRSFFPSNQELGH